MPIGRYITCVGTSLLALLLLADWYLPKTLPAPADGTINKPVIRIASIQQPPERVFIDTSQPKIVPPLTPAGDAIADEPSPPLQSYALAAPLPAAIKVDQKKRKAPKQQGHRVAAKQPRLASTPPVASASSMTAARSTKLSFLGLISRQLRLNLN
jgi:hypothetical protein